MLPRVFLPSSVDRPAQPCPRQRLRPDRIGRWMCWMTRLLGRCRAWWRCRASSTMRSWIRCRQAVVSSVRPRDGYFPNFTVGGYVLVARLPRSVSTPKLLMTWTGPWCVAIAQRLHVHGEENTVSVYRDVHVARNRFYTDAAVAITAELKEVYQHALIWQRPWIWRMRRTNPVLTWT